MTEPIPFLDLTTMHRELEDELVFVFKTALRSATFVGGPMVTDFEAAFARFCGARHTVGVANGTDALRFALMAGGVQPGDTVVTVPNTFIATTEAISQAGAHADFVDIDRRTYTMDPECLRTYLESQCQRDDRGRLVHAETGRPVTAVVPVHLYGQMADMDPILAIARAHDLLVVEDACQAHGAQYWSSAQQRWRTAGSMGRAAAFSFYPGKNLGACGEAGAVTTSDADVAHRCRLLRDHGQSRKYVHDIEGYNGRIDAIQAGILRAKLDRLAAWNEQRRAAAREYDELLSEVDGVTRPYTPAWSQPVHHLYVVRVDDREGLQAHLAAGGIGTAIHYPVPLHLAPPYARLGFARGAFPIAEQAADTILSLPMFPTLTKDAQRRVAAGIERFLHARGRTLTTAAV